MILTSGCATKRQQIISFDLPKPHMTLAHNCKKSQVPEVCAEAIEKAIKQSGELTTMYHEASSEAQACSQHSSVDEHFWTSQVAAKELALEDERWKKWYWSLISAAVAAAATAIGFTAAQ